MGNRVTGRSQDPLPFCRCRRQMQVSDTEGLKSFVPWLRWLLLWSSRVISIYPTFRQLSDWKRTLDSSAPTKNLSGSQKMPRKCRWCNQRNSLFFLLVMAHWRPRNPHGRVEWEQVGAVGIELFNQRTVIHPKKHGISAESSFFFSGLTIFSRKTFC